MPFYLDTNPEPSELSEAVNYLLSNFSTGITSDPTSGQIKGPTGETVGYLYQYMAIKYADSFDGSVNFSNTPTNRQYYGIRNSNDASESSNPTDYIWYKVSGGFGTTKSLWYVCTGGRQIQFAAATSAPDAGWLVDPGSSIDLDVVTSGNIPVIAEAFVAYFTPAILQVPRSGNPLAPSFSGITPTLYATDAGTVVPFVDAQSDTAVNFVNGTWRIGNSSTTGYGDISYTNITIGSPTDGGDYAVWPAPTAMPSSPAYITVPVRYKNSSGIVSQAGVATVQLIFTDPGAVGPYGSSIDISGYTGFVQNTGGLFTPTNATLSASIVNITSPTYSWSISGATPTSSTASSVVVTPTSSSTGVNVTLTVNGTNLLSPISKTVQLPVIYDGAPGTAGANGVMSAYPTIYIWTGSSVPPTRPSTTSTYTWSSGSYSAPSGWYTEAPSNTVAGNYLWAITVPLSVSATTTTSTLDWTNVSYPIRCIAYNGANGSNGSATFVVTRTANDSSTPTNAEVNAVIGRNPVSGDICTVNYNSGNNSVVYRYTTSWVSQATYITGGLIVDGTITGNKIAANTITASNIAASTITSTQIAASTIVASNIASNTITSSQIAAATISASNMAANSITAANAAIANAAVDTLQIAGNAVTVLVAVSGTASGTSTTMSLTAGQPVLIQAVIDGSTSPSYYVFTRTATITVNGSTIRTSEAINPENSLGGTTYWAQITALAIYTPSTTGSYTISVSATGPATATYLTATNAKR